MKEEAGAYDRYLRYLSAEPPKAEIPPALVEEIRALARTIQGWRTRHPRLEFLLSAIPLLGTTTGVLLLKFIIATQATWPLALRSSVIGVSYGFLAYGLASYGNHDCGVHSASILPRGRGSRTYRRLLANLGRLFFTDPEYYREIHLSHHAALATPEDRSFTQWVSNRRVLRSLFPGAGVLFKNDYQIHAGPEWTRSKRISLALGISLIACLMLLFQADLGWLHTWIAFGFLAPWCTMVLDRTRESLEHQLMARDSVNGTRDLGHSALGLIIAGGPWGQPFHLTHHLAPSTPWYGQWLLARRLYQSLPPGSREAFCPPSTVSFSRVVLRVLRKVQDSPPETTSLPETTEETKSTA